MKGSGTAKAMSQNQEVYATFHPEPVTALVLHGQSRCMKTIDAVWCSNGVRTVIRANVNVNQPRRTSPIFVWRTGSEAMPNSALAQTALQVLALRA